MILNRCCGGRTAHNTRKGSPGVYGLLLVALLMLSSCQMSTTPSPLGEAMACGGPFEATVRQGPNAGLSLRGDLVLRVAPGGGANAVLTLRDGSVVKATGHVTGQAINLIFVVRQDAYVFGVGTLQYPVPECAGVWGGPFVGPEQGDIGDWLSTNIKPQS